MTHTITVVYKADDEDNANQLFELFQRAIKASPADTAKVEAAYLGDAMAERDAALMVLKKAVVDYKSCRASVEEMDMDWIAEAEQLIRQ